MATKAEIALATANSFFAEAAHVLDNQRGNVSVFRNDILNKIALGSKKILEAEELDPHASFTATNDGDTVTVDIPRMKALALNLEGLVYLRTNEPKKAISAFDKAIAIIPDFADAWFHKGLAFKNLMNKSNAIDSLSKAIELDGENIGYHQALAEAHSISTVEVAIERTSSFIGKFFLFCKLAVVAMFLYGAFHIGSDPKGAFIVMIGAVAIYATLLAPFDWLREKLDL